MGGAKVASAYDYAKQASKLSGKASGRAARMSALQKMIDQRQREKAGTKATGMQPGDVDVEQQIKRSR
jgi:hypothetical protein